MIKSEDEFKKSMRESLDHTTDDEQGTKNIEEYIDFLYDFYKSQDWTLSGAVAQFMNTSKKFQDRDVSVSDRMTVLRIHLELTSPTRKLHENRQSERQSSDSSEKDSDSKSENKSDRESDSDSDRESDRDSESESDIESDSKKDNSDIVSDNDSSSDNSSIDVRLMLEKNRALKMQSLFRQQQLLQDRLDRLDKIMSSDTRISPTESNQRSRYQGQSDTEKQQPNSRNSYRDRFDDGHHDRLNKSEIVEIYQTLKNQNRDSTDRIKALEENFDREQSYIDQVRFDNDKNRYIQYRYRLHEIYDSLTRNVYLMCKVKKGLDITADMHYFFPFDEESSQEMDRVAFGHSDPEDLEQRTDNQRNGSPRHFRFDSPRGDDSRNYKHRSSRDSRTKPTPPNSPARSDNTKSLKKSRSSDDLKNDKKSVRTSFQALKFQELHKKYDKEEFHFFQNLDEGHQQLIYQMERFFVLSNQEDTPLRFRVMLKDIPLANKASIIQRIEDLQKQRLMGNGDHKYQHWLQGLLKIPFGRYKDLPVTRDDGPQEVFNYLSGVKKTLDNAVYGHKETKQQIIQLIAQWISNPTSVGNVIGIQGPMGNGKTTLVRHGIAEAIKRPFHFISLGGASDSSYLDGHSYTYEGSTWGRIVETLIQSNCMNPVFYFDELDKVSKTHRGEEIMNLLIHLTDPTQNSKFQDKYFSGIDIDLSRSVFIFSYNDKSKINPILLDRLYNVKTDGFKTDDKICIVKDYLLPSLLETQGLKPSQLQFDDEMIKYVVTDFTKEEGVRGLKKHISNLLSYVNILLLTGKKDLLPEKLQGLDISTTSPVVLTREIISTVLQNEEEDDKFNCNLYL